MKMLNLLIMAVSIVSVVSAKEYHVSKDGSDANNGSASKPHKTISGAAQVAMPGDVITVHAGTYRERIDPPRGGVSDTKPIVYRAAKGEKVVIKGSEIVKGWQKVKGDTWKVTIPNSFFGDFNPYGDLIVGDWFNPMGREHHTGAVYLNDHWHTEAAKLEDVLKPIGQAAMSYGSASRQYLLNAASLRAGEGSQTEDVPDNLLWYAEVDSSNTTIWAQFGDIDPNRSQVEINVRQTVFYPEKPGINYITVRGFSMMHAATPWSPPTAEQIGLIGTHWSKGWIIEDNDIRYSVCTGVTLGKHGDEFDNTSANSAEGYVKTIERGLAQGWSKENIGHHIVRNNRISHCEQAGMVGSLGPVFCTVTGNIIHDIHIRRLFTGAEMAGIKFHGAIDTVISGNHIYRTNRGIWLDWMAQGTRVTGNLLHDNGPSEDLFVEVNHGPFLIDNNIFLSRIGVLVNSQGGAYVHNLIAGDVRVIHGERRRTPYHKPHSTELAGLHSNPSGDDRYYSNIFVNVGLANYDKAKLPVFMAGNVFLNGAKPSKHEHAPVVQPDFNPNLKLIEKDDGMYLQITTQAYKKIRTGIITTELLGRALISDLAYENIDGSMLKIDTDYFGKKRKTPNPAVGPFENSDEGEMALKVWPAQ